MTTRLTPQEILEAEVSQAGSGTVNLGKPTYGKSLTQLAVHRLRRDYLTLVALGIIIILTLAALAAPLLEKELLPSGEDYRKTNVAIKYLPINSENHLLGTDNLGRDHLIRLLYGGRVSLGIGFGAAFLSLAIGMSIGVISGYNQGATYPFGLVDDFLMWLITTLNSIPQLFLLIIIFSVFRPSMLSLIIILALLGWTSTMRLVRGETLSQRNREYIVAAQAIGASSWRIMFQHIIPNVLSVLIVSLAIDIGTLILVEAGLSFLGLGIQEPTPSWGNMLTKSQDFFRQGPHLSVIPGLLITTTVLCLYVIGDGLRDAFDPRNIKN